MGTFVWLYSPRTNSLHLTMNSFVVLIQTPKGFRSIDLEGFSEDLNEDGFVDPVVPAVPAPIVAPAPIAPVYNSVPAVSPYFPQAPIAAPIAAPVFNGAAPVFANDALLYNGAAPFYNGAAPVFNGAAPIFNPAPVASPVFSAPTTVVRTSVAPSPAVFRTISPLPAPVRAAPSAVVYDSRLHG